MPTYQGTVTTDMFSFWIGMGRRPSARRQRILCSTTIAHTAQSLVHSLVH